MRFLKNQHRERMYSTSLILTTLRRSMTHSDYTVGDMVISDIATLIREQFTDEAVVGRVGGDEFMVFVKDTSLQEAEAKAEQLCTNVQKTLSGDGAVIVVTLSVEYGYDRKRRV